MTFLHGFRGFTSRYTYSTRVGSSFFNTLTPSKYEVHFLGKTGWQAKHMNNSVFPFRLHDPPFWHGQHVPLGLSETSQTYICQIWWILRISCKQRKETHFLKLKRFHEGPKDITPTLLLNKVWVVFVPLKKQGITLTNQLGRNSANRYTVARIDKLCMHALGYDGIVDNDCNIYLLNHGSD